MAIHAAQLAAHMLQHQPPPPVPRPCSTSPCTATLSPGAQLPPPPAFKGSLRGNEREAGQCCPGEVELGRDVGEKVLGEMEGS